MELVWTVSERRIRISIDHLREKDWILVLTTSGRKIGISMDRLREKD